MRAWGVLRLKVRALVRGGARDRADRDEMQAHLDHLTQEYLDRGCTPRQARDRAQRDFGAIAQFQEASRDARGLRWLTDAGQDVRIAARMLRRTPGFTVAAILTLALGLGANTAIFSLVDAVLLRSLPVIRPQELVFITDDRDGGPSYPYIERLRTGASSFVEIAGVAADELRIEVDGTLEQVYGQIASGNYFSVLGIVPAAGRLLTPGDETLDPAVAVIGYGYWQRRFGGSPAAIGKTVRFDERQFTIVGVTPPAFSGMNPGRQIDLTLPITQAAGLVADSGARGWFDAVARVRPSVTIAQATAEADAVFQAFRTDMRQTAAERARPARIVLTPASHGDDGLRVRFGGTLVALTAIAALVLVIACANIGNLLLARGVARARDLAVRVAIGAGGGRLLRQALTETLLLFLFGMAAGLVVASVAIETLTGFFAIGRNPIVLDVSFDWRRAAYAGAIAVGAGLLTGLWPALRAARADPQTAMKEGQPRLAGSRRVAATGRLLVTAQIALSLVLLVTAMIFARTMWNLRRVDLGFTGTQVLTMSLDVAAPPEDAATERRRMWKDVVDAVRRVPGVGAASLSVLTPLSGRNTSAVVAVAGDQPRDEAARSVRLNHISEDYFRTFGIDLVAGRAFTPRDIEGAPAVAVINEAAAREYFAGRSPIGETIMIGARGHQIVGVIRDHKHQSVRQPVPRFAFVPLWQPLEAVRRITLSLSSDQPPATLAPTVVQVVRGVHPGTLVSDVIDVQEQIDASLTGERLLSTLATAFAVLALGLAAIGLYGVLSYAVAIRRSEFGVRITLGARPGRVARDVVRGVMAHVAVGMSLGLLIALATSRAVEAMLFGVTPGDPVVFALASVMLGVVAAIAAWVPARRAARTDPLRALRAG